MSAERAHSVFLNHPYDDAYAPLADALLFTVLANGYLPRSALETGTVATARMERIFTALQASAYSIHDLSRCQGEGSAQLARFNMPLELGMAMALRYRGDAHEWLALAPTGHPYQRFVSDLSGFDLPPYDGTPRLIVREVAVWLRTRPTAPTPVLDPRATLGCLPTFSERLAQLREANLGTVPWPDRLDCAADVIDEARKRGSRSECPPLDQPTP